MYARSIITWEPHYKQRVFDKEGSSVDILKSITYFALSANDQKQSKNIKNKFQHYLFRLLRSLPRYLMAYIGASKGRQCVIYKESRLPSIEPRRRV